MLTIENSPTGISDDTSRVVDQLASYETLVAGVGSKIGRMLKTLRKMADVNPCVGIRCHEIHDYSLGVHRTRSQSAAQSRCLNASHFLISDHCGIFLSAAHSRGAVAWRSINNWSQLLTNIENSNAQR
jgi:hypothetical protein